MAFRERSAWVMGILMALAGIWYLNMLVQVSHALGAAAPPISIFMPYVLLVIVASIMVQVALALGWPKEADAKADERERIINDRAGNWSGLVLGFGAVTGLLHYLAHEDGNQLFHIMMGALILSQIAEYAIQILLFRRGV